VLLVGLLLSLSFWHYSRAAHRSEIEVAFKLQSDIAISSIDARLRHFQRALLATRGLFRASGTVDRKEFAVFVASLDLEPGIQGIGFALAVSAVDKDRHLAEIRSQGFPDYQIRPLGDRERYSPVIFLEPFSGANLQAFGYDMLTDPLRQEAMEWAVETGLTSLTGKVHLVQDPQRQPAFLLFVPVFRNGTAIETPEDRRRNLVGWVYGLFRMSDFMHGVLAEVDKQGLDIEIFDGPVRAESLVFDRDGILHALAGSSDQASHTILFGGHTWTVVTRIMPELRARHRDTSATVLGLGSLVSLLLGMLALFALRYNESLRWQVEDQTRRLRESEALYRSILSASPEDITITDLAGRILMVSPAALMTIGCAREDDLLGHLIIEFIAPEDRERASANITLLLQGVRTGAMEYRGLRPDGSRFDMESNGEFIRGAGDEPTGLVFVVRDITERKRAEQAISESEKKFRLLFELSPVGLAMVSHETGEFLEVNDALLRQTGYSRSEFIKLKFWDITPPEYEAQELQQLRDLNETGHFGPNEKEYIRKDGSRYPIVISGAVFVDGSGNKVVWGIIEDITERRQAETERDRLETQNRQLQKAESLGLMAGSIAHHFNNKLQAVMANLEVMSALPKGADPVKFLVAARQATEKAAEVSRLMLIYLGQTALEQKPCSLSEICRGSLGTLQKALPAKVALEVDFPSPDPIIRANADQFQEVLIALVTNAWEAMNDHEGCIRLGVKTEPATKIPTAHRFPVGWEPQKIPYACLEVADDGCGIAGPDFEKLFDPFFSTKFIGRGLGLSAVLGIVQAHGGGLTVESRRGQGSTFRVHLPLSSEAVPSEPEVRVSASSPEATGTVLLVDDDALLLESTGAMIERLGFKVLTARDGLEALDVFRQHSEEIRCVLTDLTMPRMDGWETLTALRQLEPALPVILASGYGKSQVMSGTHTDQPQVFLNKPYGLQQVREALAQALGSR